MTLQGALDHWMLIGRTTASPVAPPRGKERRRGSEKRSRLYSVVNCPNSLLMQPTSSRTTIAVPEANVKCRIYQLEGYRSAQKRDSEVLEIVNRACSWPTPAVDRKRCSATLCDSRGPLRLCRLFDLLAVRARPQRQRPLHCHATVFLPIAHRSCICLRLFRNSNGIGVLFILSEQFPPRVIRLCVQPSSIIPLQRAKRSRLVNRHPIVRHQG